MTDFNQLFEGELSKHVYVVAGILIVIVAAHAALYLHARQAGIIAWWGRLGPLAVTAASALLVMAGSINFLTQPVNSATRPEGASMIEIMGKSDLTKLPVQLADAI